MDLLTPPFATPSTQTVLFSAQNHHNQLHGHAARRPNQKDRSKSQPTNELTAVDGERLFSIITALPRDRTTPPPVFNIPWSYNYHKRMESTITTFLSRTDEQQQQQCHRKEASGFGWQERFVDVDRASETLSVGEAVAQSLSYVILPHFASIEECTTLKDAAQSLQDIYLRDGDSDPDVFKEIVVKWVTECSRYSVTRLLNDDANTVSDILLRRLLSYLEFGRNKDVGDKELSNLALQLFNTKSNLQENYVAHWYDEMSHDDKGSNPEPMVNIYEQGGFFKRHNDGMHITLLVVLEDAEEGGGTAFYKTHDEDEQDDEEDGPADPMLARKRPERIEKPPVGTAMIWGGKLSHSAMPVIRGNRAVYVGSFDLVETNNNDDSNSIVTSKY